MSITRRGDTMIEVLFAIAVFALVSVLSIIVMNSGVATVEATLELSVARNEIDAQSEALRFIHNSFLSEREFRTDAQEYSNIWKELKSNINASDSNAVLPITVDNCETRYTGENSENIFARKTIILNTRKIDPASPKKTIISVDNNTSARDIFRPAVLSPRLIFNKDDTSSDDTTSDTNLYEGEKYTNLRYAEGIWVVPIASQSTGKDSSNPEFYDFHVYTCWFAPGREIPTTIGTIMRLYNPELIEVGK